MTDILYTNKINNWSTDLSQGMPQFIPLKELWNLLITANFNITLEQYYHQIKQSDANCLKLNETSIFVTEYIDND